MQRITTKVTEPVTGVILAGGRAIRMGGEDKGLVLLHDRPMIQWVLDRLSPQVSKILISANRNKAKYAAFGYPTVADTAAEFQGPLAGIAAALAEADTPWLVSVPCDSPLIPLDLVERLHDRVVRGGAMAGAAHDGQRLQPVFTLVHRDLLTDLVSYLQGGERKIDRWLERHSFRSVDFTDRREMFLNVNTPVDLQTATTWLHQSESDSGS
jgi:molybdopterin-guanine dinucleotide biosynthesis protein A